MKFLTVTQAAEALGVHKTTVSALIRNNQLKASDVSLKPNSRKPRYRISEAQLAAFMKARDAAPIQTSKRGSSGREFPEGYVARW